MCRRFNLLLFSHASSYITVNKCYVSVIVKTMLLLALMKLCNFCKDKHKIFLMRVFNNFLVKTLINNSDTNSTVYGILLKTCTYVPTYFCISAKFNE